MGRLTCSPSPPLGTWRRLSTRVRVSAGLRRSRSTSRLVLRRRTRCMRRRRSTGAGNVVGGNFGMGGVRVERLRGVDIREPAMAHLAGAMRADRDEPDAVGFQPGDYDTCRVVNVTGTSNVEVVGRGVDGLHVWELNAQGVWQQLATLSAFSMPMAGTRRSIGLPSIRQSRRVRVRAAGGGRRGPNGVVVYKYDTTANQRDNCRPPTGQPDRSPWGSTRRITGRCVWEMRRATVARTRSLPGGRTGSAFVLRPARSDGMEHVRAVGVSRLWGDAATAYATANALPAVQAFLVPVG